ncbi:hypothetical protein CMV_021478 [Castanea mollissima]|uniref:Uncharacterized protein n=1 Tax=Castanea mollissima TaxID=60419 RepID=A0A8J4QJZ8_9ROSI|nr:hypothetical protein CMV_021478 [Castanea mollissima]
MVADERIILESQPLDPQDTERMFSDDLGIVVFRCDDDLNNFVCCSFNVLCFLLIVGLIYKKSVIEE